jgi:hypothetical protein
VIQDKKSLNTAEKDKINFIETLGDMLPEEKTIVNELLDTHTPMINKSDMETMQPS